MEEPMENWQLFIILSAIYLQSLLSERSRQIFGTFAAVSGFVLGFIELIKFIKV